MLQKSFNCGNATDVCNWTGVCICVSVCALHFSAAEDLQTGSASARRVFEVEEISAPADRSEALRRSKCALKRELCAALSSPSG